MRRVLTTRRLAAAAALPLLLGGLAACGDDGSDEASMGEETSESSSPEDEGSSEDSDPAEGEQIEPKSFAEDVGDGLESVTTAHMTLETTGGQAEMSMTGEVDYTGDTPEMAATMTGAGLPEDMEMIMVDEMIYISDPTSKGKYMQVDLNDPSGPMAGMGELTDQMDLRSSMKTFTEALTEVTFVGEEDVDGEELEHYELVMDPSKADAMKSLPADTGPLTYDAWFDDDKIMRQVVIEMPQGMGTMTMKLSDLGADVEIEAPPANKIVKMPGA